MEIKGTWPREARRRQPIARREVRLHVSERERGKEGFLEFVVMECCACFPCDGV